MIVFRHQEPQLDFSDVLMIPRASEHRLASRSQIDVVHPVYQTVPVIVANMDSIGTFAMAEHLLPFNIMVALLKDATVAEWEEEVSTRKLMTKNLIPTMGVRDLASEISRIHQLTQLFPDIPFVCLDVANGYLPMLADAIKQLKDSLPHIKVCAGNVVDEKGVELLAQAGASIVKVGIGSGGVCLTRMKTGVGYPQLSAVQHAVEAGRALNVEIISDGGISVAGDFAKAFAAGADFVMAGSFFAGHEETGLHFHGMSSDGSRVARGEQVLDYRATEGREVLLKSKGSIGHTMRDLLGGLRSACTYLGVTALADLKAAEIEFIRVNRQLNRISGVNEER